MEKGGQKPPKKKDEKKQFKKPEPSLLNLGKKKKKKERCRSSFKTPNSNSKYKMFTKNEKIRKNKRLSINGRRIHKQSKRK